MDIKPLPQTPILSQGVDKTTRNAFSDVHTRLNQLIQLMVPLTDVITAAAWQPNKTYAVGDICYSPNAPSYTRMECVVAGRSGTTEPTWPTVGNMVVDGTVTWIVDDVRDGTPVGRIVAEISPICRPGYLKANGALVSRAAYPRLWAYVQARGLVVPDTVWPANYWGCFSTGDGSTTFRLPDLRGEFIRGGDDGRGVDGGRAFGSWQADGIKSHNHPYQSQPYLFVESFDGGDVIAERTSTAKWVTHYTSNFGGPETRPRNIALLYCIKY
ncbi:hypothetical protein TcarDRAFT_1289 [Thermosinus carboxydivorans Nor1]|uniref:Uncharacterized protein n=1 Tax=Thermosinus carboxydivorans Nor1 TaxID=401526 RepID=A1HR57_9FIRM|nr:phage tail protein [Thermosinus carboxydivorans]EAX47554.1 hypothetical protein TcarDRAFT_1289 [Thermosinus carboxydivorans Nor1]